MSPGPTLGVEDRREEWTGNNVNKKKEQKLGMKVKLYY